MIIKKTRLLQNCIPSADSVKLNYRTEESHFKVRFFKHNSAD